jgi:hypothetical protein
MTPKLAAFPKCYMDELCVHRTMTVGDWIEMGATLGVQGLEFYSGFIEDNEAFLRETKASLQKHGPDADALLLSRLYRTCCRFAGATNYARKAHDRNY